MDKNINAFKNIFPYNEEEILQKPLDELFEELSFYFDMPYRLKYERSI